MLTDGFSTIKLADFGLGNTFEAASDYVEASRVIGAALYMAPELFMGKKPQFKKDVDVWAFGCIVYELLHFKRLFDGAGVFAQINVSADTRVPFEDHCPNELKELVNDCTKKAPKERITISEVVDRITQIRDSIVDSIG